MADLVRTSPDLYAERAVLVQVTPHWDRAEAEETFRELENLADTAGAVVAGSLRQHLRRPHPRHYVGKGKLEEVRQLCEQVQADVVVCDDELSPSQVRTMEEALQLKVVDRTEVILDIFAAHARSKQAKVQVEMAQLQYELPRLKGLWVHLDRTAGGTLGGPAGGGIGVRGPGERQLETDRRLAQRRVAELKSELADLRKQRQLTAHGRTERFATVALVGYTNAGKSSLMNALTDAGVSVRDRLFETLDTRTRQWDLPCGRDVLLSDTVGFIRKFPHHLAASFEATLEEVREADLLLHVVDASKRDSEQEIRAVNAVLEQVDCLGKPTIYLLNKSDLVAGADEVALVRKLVGEAVCTSAVTGQGLDELRQRARAVLEEQHGEMLVRVPVSDGRLVAFVHAHGQVMEQRCDGTTVELRVRAPARLPGMIRRMGGEVIEQAQHPAP